MKIYKIKYKLMDEKIKSRLYASTCEDDALIEFKQELSLRFNSETLGNELYIISCNLK